jgi:threonine efflux protein
MLTTLLSIWLLHVAASVTPGANVLLVSQLSISNGRRTGLFAALGVTLGAGMWATLAVLGVDAVFKEFPSIRLSLQIAGGFYLLYVAVRLWRSGAPRAAGVAAFVSPWAAFRLGLFTNVTNPKSALFFGSVFAALLPASATGSLKAIAVSVVLVNALLWHGFLAYAFSRSRVRSTYAKHQRFINRTAGTILSALGLRILAGAIISSRL